MCVLSLQFKLKRPTSCFYFDILFSLVSVDGKDLFIIDTKLMNITKPELVVSSQRDAQDTMQGGREKG